MLSGERKKDKKKHSFKSYVRQINKSILNLFNRGQMFEHDTVQAPWNNSFHKELTWVPGKAAFKKHRTKMHPDTALLADQKLLNHFFFHC